MEESGGISRGRRKRVVSGDQRERAIVDALVSLLTARSFGEISVEDIARGAGLSRPSFYFYFSSKEEVMLAIADRVVGEMRSRVDPASRTLADDPEKRWEEIIHGIWEIWRSNRSLLIACSEASAGNPEVRRVWQGAMSYFIEQTERMILSERERGAAPESGVLASELSTVLNWTNERMFYQTFSEGDNAVPEDRVVAVLTGFWLNSIYGSRPD